MIEEAQRGELFIVATPIGNLGDITYRAVELLNQADLVAAEDTRRTRVLLNHYGIKTALSSYNSFNKEKKSAQFVEFMKSGRNLALVSDAGTPGISDPLYHIARLAVEEGIRLQSLPGPSSILAALTVSGLPIDRFIFEGFLPRKKGRQKLLQELAHETRAIVLFESPKRIQKTLKDLSEHLGDRPATVTRELTKMHEETVRGTLTELAQNERNWKGEITLVTGRPGKQEKEN